MAGTLKKFILFILALSFVLFISFQPTKVSADESAPSPSPSPSPQEEKKEDPPDDCKFSCIGDSFQEIFPFDIFSGIPESGEFTCPQFTIFTRSFEFCLFVDAVSVLKYPVIVALLIKVYLFS